MMQSQQWHSKINISYVVAAAAQLTFRKDKRFPRASTLAPENDTHNSPDDA